jgi:hypothetical protein
MVYGRGEKDCLLPLPGFVPLCTHALAEITITPKKLLFLSFKIEAGLHIQGSAICVEQMLRFVPLGGVLLAEL